MNIDGQSIIRPTGEGFSLAGYNLIYKAWQNQGNPVDAGWHASADDLIKIQTSSNHDYSTRRLVMDFDPNAIWRIGLIELLDIYAFTWGDGKSGASWTPLMLRLRDIHYKEYDTPIDEGHKSQILSALPAPNPNSNDFVEFLYLNGPSYGWNWGKNGMTNAVFLQGGARDYFRQFL